MHPAPFGFAGLLNTLSITIEMPAMKRTPQAVVLEPTKTQISATMWAGAAN